MKRKKSAKGLAEQKSKTVSISRKYNTCGSEKDHPSTFSVIKVSFSCIIIPYAVSGMRFSPKKKVDKPIPV
jgi:hypothetical protein